MNQSAPDGLAAFTDEQRELFDAMSEVSEISYAAGWVTGNEHAVWRLIHDGGRFGQETWDVAAEELERVRRALRAANCWITWPEDSPQVTSLSDWTVLVAERARIGRLF